MNEPGKSHLLYLIRHGIADGVEGRCIGHTDVPLSGNGRAQCAALARVWRPPADATIWSSDLARARDSARVFSQSWGRSEDDVRIDAALRECAFGEWDGHTWAEIEARDALRLERWMRDWSTEAPPGGESLPMLVERVRGALRAITGITESTNHVIVSHAGVLRATLSLVLGAPDTAAFNWAMPHAHVSAVRMSRVGNDGMVGGSVEWLHAFPSPAAC